MHVPQRLTHIHVYVRYTSSTSGNIISLQQKLIDILMVTEILAVVHTFFKSSTPPSAACRRSTNLDVSRPRDFSWRPPCVGEALPPSSVSVSDIYNEWRYKLKRSREIGRTGTCFCRSSLLRLFEFHPKARSVNLIGQLGQFNHVTTTLIKAHHHGNLLTVHFFLAHVGLRSVIGMLAKSWFCVLMLSLLHAGWRKIVYYKAFLTLSKIICCSGGIHPSPCHCSWVYRYDSGSIGIFE